MLHHVPDAASATPPLLHDVASTGIAELDHALGGLFWGDNAVFEVADPPMVEPFYRAAAAVKEHYDRRLYVDLSGVPTELRGFDVIDARPASCHSPRRCSARSSSVAGAAKRTWSCSRPWR